MLLLLPRLFQKRCWLVVAVVSAAVGAAGAAGAAAGRE